MWIAGLGSSMDEKMLRRFEATGCPVLVGTIEDGGANTIGAKSVQRVGVRDLDREADERCVGCHAGLPQITRIRPDTPMDVLGAIGALQGETSLKLNWDNVKRVRAMTRMKIVLKGIVSVTAAERVRQKRGYRL